MGRWQWPGHLTGTLTPTLGLADGVDGLTAFISYTTGEAAGVTHVPYADGQGAPSHSINDYNDSLTIGATLCAALGCPFHGGAARIVVRQPIICEATP